MLSSIDTAQLEVAHLSGLDESGRVLVRTTRGGRQVVEPAWLGVSLTRPEIEALADLEERVVLARPAGLAGACVIVGILRDRVLPHLDPPREVILEASERLIVRCGTARIVLHGDGRCEVHAERISQRARGVHAIKGAAVRIN